MFIKSYKNQVKSFHISLAMRHWFIHVEFLDNLTYFKRYFCSNTKNGQSCHMKIKSKISSWTMVNSIDEMKSSLKTSRDLATHVVTCNIQWTETLLLIFFGENRKRCNQKDALNWLKVIVKSFTYYCCTIYSYFK